MWSAGSGGGRPLPGLWGARKDAGSPGTRVAGHRGTRGASERRGSGVQGCAAPGLRNILLRDCRGSGNVGPRNTLRGQEEESNWGRKQEAAGFFFFFSPFGTTHFSSGLAVACHAARGPDRIGG